MELLCFGCSGYATQHNAMSCKAMQHNKMQCNTTEHTRQPQVNAQDNVQCTAQLKSKDARYGARAHAQHLVTPHNAEQPEKTTRQEATLGSQDHSMRCKAACHLLRPGLGLSPCDFIFSNVCALRSDL